MKLILKMILATAVAVLFIGCDQSEQRAKEDFQVVENVQKKCLQPATASERECEIAVQQQIAHLAKRRVEAAGR